MRRIWTTLAGIAAAASAVPAPAAHAGERSAITLGHPVAPPVGYAEMCVETPSLCPRPAEATSHLPLSMALIAAAPGTLQAIGGLLAPAILAPIPDLVSTTLASKVGMDGMIDRAAPVLAVERQVKLLKRVNRLVNRRVLQRRDIESVGVDDRWSPSGIARGAVGDCEDIAMEKRLQLAAAGIAPDRLSLAVVYSRSAGLHTVLVARTDAGDWVLDNRRAAVLPWTETRYTWVAMQSSHPSREWRAVL